MESERQAKVWILYHARLAFPALLKMIYTPAMEQSSKPSASIIAAAVVAMVGSLLFSLSSVAALAGILFFPRPDSAQDLQPFVKTISIGMTVVMICVSIFGFATGIGLLRLKNWGRISAIVWSGFCIFFGVVGIPIALLMPFDQLPNALAVGSGFPLFLRLFLLVFYGVPLGIGVWWLILLNRKNIKAKFVSEVASSSLTADTRPRRSVAITVLAWFFIGSTANVVLYPFFPFRMPLILFGHIFPGVSATGFLVLSGVLVLVAGIGLLKLQRWSYSFTIGMQLFILSNGVLTVLNPNFERVMASVVRQMNNSMHLSNNFVDSPSYTFPLHLVLYATLFFSAAVLVLLFYCRERFLKAAEANKLQQFTLGN